jgi:hypothetical protein
MKLKKFAHPVIDLSDTPSVAIVTKLKKNDLVVFEGIEWNVEVPPKKAQKGMWIVGLAKGEERKYVKVVENNKPKMTAHEKKTMIQNINGVLNMFKENEPKLIGLVEDYYRNLSEHNNYDDKDIRECMSKFPIELLKKSGIVL